MLKPEDNGASVLAQNTPLFFNVSAILHRFATQQVPSTEAFTPLKVYNFLYFQGGGCLCRGHLLSGESMTNSAYVKNNGVDLLYKLVFCGISVADPSRD